MHRYIPIASGLLPALLFFAPALRAQTDVKGSSDHPLFPNRMPGYSISSYQQQGFSAYSFRTKPVTKIEGKYTRIHYYLKNPQEHPGGLAIRRNYENAIKAAGGNPRFTIYPQAGHDAWTETYANDEIYSWLLQQRRRSSGTSLTNLDQPSIRELGASARR